MRLPSQTSVRISVAFLVLCSIFATWPGVPGGGVGVEPGTAHAQGPTSEWFMTAANPARTSWVSEEVAGDIGAGTIRVEWYRPIEAYIPQDVQLIAANGLIYVSTAKGLYALNAATGQLAWRFDTELPLGNSPSVVDGVAYVGGFDRKIHALNALNGSHLWEFTGAGAGYSTNPLVINGRVFAGNRDGYMYAIGAHGTSLQGRLLWRFKTGGPILISAAYKDGIVFFASNDNYAYALRADTGAQVWKSAQLLGDGFHTFWPVIYNDKVIFSGASGYRAGLNPGVSSVENASGSSYDQIHKADRDAVFFDKQVDDLMGPPVQINEPWAQGETVLDASRITEYLEDDPTPNGYLHKPWRRTYFVLNGSNGTEYSFDSDNDGHREYAPFTWAGTHSGNRYPPAIGPDNIPYATNIFIHAGSIAQARVMGWRIGTPYMIIARQQSAVDEPQALSFGGDLLYRNLCMNRVGDYSDITSTQAGSFWGYNARIGSQAPGFNVEWYGMTASDQSSGNYGTLNGVYGNHGDQNPIIPYQGRLYVHRSNAIIAYGPGASRGALPLLTANIVHDSTASLSIGDLRQRLEEQVRAIVEAGHLRPGYYNSGTFLAYAHMADYFANPGETISTLAQAYPNLSSELQQQTLAYLQSEFRAYFDPVMYSYTGWADGATREAMPLPPEVQSSLGSRPKATRDSYSWPWAYPQQNFYAMWKYAQVVPQDAGRAYDLAKTKLQVPAGADDTRLATYPYEHNAYIAGYIGFLNLQTLAGKTQADSTLRNTVQTELNRLLNLRATEFSKDTPWVFTSWSSDYPRRVMNVSRNFNMMVPELADYLSAHSRVVVTQALQEYLQVAPYWFVARHQATLTEGASQNLYDYPALFQARAKFEKASREEVTKYLDVPAFPRGDLFYIQNVIAAIEAEPGPVTMSQVFLPSIHSNVH